jgi:hypothetical protein
LLPDPYLPYFHREPYLHAAEIAIRRVTYSAFAFYCRIHGRRLAFDGKAKWQRHPAAAPPYAKRQDAAATLFCHLAHEVTNAFHWRQ